MRSRAPSSTGSDPRDRGTVTSAAHPPRRPQHRESAGGRRRALRRLGYEAEVWEYGDNPFGYEVDRTIPLDTEARDPSVFWQTFQEAIERFDVFHFHFARTFFPNDWGGLPPFWDLPIYRILGKKVYFTFHGTDIRIRRIHEQVNPWSHYRTSDIASDDDRTEKVIEVCRAYADELFVVSVDTSTSSPRRRSCRGSSTSIVA